jgi:hypothetical protein
MLPMMMTTMMVFRHPSLSFVRLHGIPYRFTFAATAAQCMPPG